MYKMIIDSLFKPDISAIVEIQAINSLTYSLSCCIYV